MTTTMLWCGLALFAAALSFQISRRWRRRQIRMSRAFHANTVCRRCGARDELSTPGHRSPNPERASVFARP